MKARMVQIIITAGIIFALGFSTGFSSGTYYGKYAELRKNTSALIRAANNGKNSEERKKIATAPTGANK